MIVSFSADRSKNPEEQHVKDDLNGPEMIPIRATFISAIFVIPYIVILKVFTGVDLFYVKIKVRLNRSWWLIGLWR